MNDWNDDSFHEDGLNLGHKNGKANLHYLLFCFIFKVPYVINFQMLGKLYQESIQQIKLIF